MPSTLPQRDSRGRFIKRSAAPAAAPVLARAVVAPVTRVSIGAVLQRAASDDARAQRDAWVAQQDASQSRRARRTLVVNAAAVIAFVVAPCAALLLHVM